MAKVTTFVVEDGEVFSGERKFAEGDEVRPSGSVGFYRLEGGQLVRYSGNRRRQYSFAFTGDGEYRAGPNFAHRVKRADEETDPILRILRKLDIPVSILERASEPTIEVSERWYDNHHCPVGRNTNEWVHDGRETSLSSKMLEEPQGYFGGGGYEVSVIEGASYAVRVDYGRYMNGCGWSRPGKIVVWSHCDPTTLADALAKAV